MSGMPTPRFDAFEREQHELGSALSRGNSYAGFARVLERELAAAKIERDELKVAEAFGNEALQRARAERDQWRACAEKLAERVSWSVGDNDGMPDYTADYEALDEFERLKKETP